MVGVSILFGVLLPVVASTTTVYVAYNSPVDGPGTAWNNAFHTIQQGIDFDTANPNTVVLVSNGVYDVGGKVVAGLLTTNRVCIDKPGIIVRSVNGPEVTIIKGQGPLGDNAVRCVYVISNAVVEGFTLTGGNTHVSGDSDDLSGGGVLSDYRGSVNDCIITGNSAYLNGGGVYHAQVYRCTISSNRADRGGGVAGSTVYNSLLENNKAEGYGGAVYLCNTYGSTLIGNSAVLGAGGAYYGNLKYSIILNNSGLSGDNWDSDVSLDYCCTKPLPTNGVGNIDADPQFVPNSAYHLFASSPCIDAGGNYAISGTDRDGKLRKYDGNGDGVAVVDMGCYETRTWYVNETNYYDGPGTNWNRAFHEIEDAVLVAEDYDLVIVSNGVYDSGGTNFGGLLKNRVAINKPITVKSVNGPEVTTIRGLGSHGSWAVRCAYVGTNAVLSGFTLNNGHTFSSGSLNDKSGGGAHCASSGTIEDCIITGNSAYVSGGGVRYGIINRCKVSGNTANSYGGGICYGRVDQCTIISNYASFFGGGTYYAAVRNSLLFKNSAATDGGGGVGGSFVNCTLTDNFSSGGVGGTYNSSLKNSIIWDNIGSSNNNWIGGSSSYCCIEPLPTNGIGNIDVDPQFVPNSDYHLYASSPGMDSGSDLLVYGEADCDGKPRIYDSDGDGVAAVDMGCYETRTWYVNESNVNDGPGTNWAMAYRILQMGIQLAGDYDLVVVSNGVYIASGLTVGGTLGSRAAINKPITVKSINGPDVTIIKGYGGQDGINARRCAYVGTNAVLDGFTLTDGHTRTGGSNNDRSGGGAWCEDSGIINNCIISNNTANYNGGGICYGRVNRCAVSSNSAYNGGGVYDCIIYNSILTHNVATDDGGGGSAGEFYNCTISENSADTGGGVSYGSLYNSIVWANTGLSGNSNWLVGSFAHCCTAPLPSGTGNIGTNPELEMDSSSDVYLYPASFACIDSGDNSVAWGEYDYDGEYRILDGNSDSIVTVDMGCFEHLSYNSDTDGDLMTDGWEHDHGLNCVDASDADKNSDSDGANNYAEYIADTDPIDSNSYFVVTAFSNSPQATVYFDSTNQRNYTLQSCSNLLNDSWANVSGAGPVAGGAISLSDTNQPPKGKYYRVKVALP
jgi:parallel beta-helix repeat protein